MYPSLEKLILTSGLMVADGIFNISTVVVLLYIDSMNIDYEH